MEINPENINQILTQEPTDTSVRPFDPPTREDIDYIEQPFSHVVDRDLSDGKKLGTTALQLITPFDSNTKSSVFVSVTNASKIDFSSKPKLVVIYPEIAGPHIRPFSH